MEKQPVYLISTSLVLIQGEDQKTLLIKKGNREIVLEFTDPQDRDHVVHILMLTTKPTLFTEVLSAFPLDQQEDIEKIISRLIELKILLNRDDSNESDYVLERHFERALDNYLWEKEVSWSEFVQYKEHLKLKIIGCNKLGFCVADLLRKMGINEIELVDEPYLKSSTLFPEMTSSHLISSDQFWDDVKKMEPIVIIADEYGNIPGLIRLNRLLLEKKLSFLPLFVFSQIGYIGPLVVPGRTSCLECLLSKIEQTGGPLNLLNATESEYFAWQEQLSPHPSVVATLAHVFSFQFISRIASSINCLSKVTDHRLKTIYTYCNATTEIDLQVPKIVERRLIRSSNCPSCRELRNRQKIIFDFAKEYIS